jgi:hypothetical protein
MLQAAIDVAQLTELGLVHLGPRFAVGFVFFEQLGIHVFERPFRSVQSVHDSAAGFVQQWNGVAASGPEHHSSEVVLS